jgi:hypothetical protein
MKYTLLSLLLCLVLGFDWVHRENSAGESTEINSSWSPMENTSTLPGYMGDVVIDDQRFDSYLVPDYLNASAVDFVTASTRAWTLITSTSVKPNGESLTLTARNLTRYANDRLVLGDPTHISYRYTIGSGDIVENDVKCEKATSRNEGMELQCIDGETRAQYTVHLIPSR